MSSEICRPVANRLVDNYHRLSGIFERHLYNALNMAILFLLHHGLLIDNDVWPKFCVATAMYLLYTGDVQICLLPQTSCHVRTDPELNLMFELGFRVFPLKYFYGPP